MSCHNSNCSTRRVGWHKIHFTCYQLQLPPLSIAGPDRYWAQQLLAVKFYSSSSVWWKGDPGPHWEWSSPWHPPEASLLTDQHMASIPLLHSPVPRSSNRANQGNLLIHEWNNAFFRSYNLVNILLSSNHQDSWTLISWCQRKSCVSNTGHVSKRRM